MLLVLMLRLHALMRSSMLMMRSKSSSESKGMVILPFPYYAWGAGAENFRGCRDNTDIPKAIAKAMGAEMK